MQQFERNETYLHVGINSKQTSFNNVLLNMNYVRLSDNKFTNKLVNFTLLHEMSYESRISVTLLAIAFNYKKPQLCVYYIFNTIATGMS